MTAMTWPAALGQRWRALAARERMLIAAAGAVLGAALVWWLGLAPALRTMRAAPAQIEAVEGQLQEMQRLATEVRELRALPALPLAQAQAALSAAAQRQGDQLRLNLQGERATLDIASLPGDALVEWLAEVRMSARARVVEAQLGRTPQGQYRGRLVLMLGGRP